MGIITQTILKCDDCGVEANCGGLSNDRAQVAMRKRRWYTHHAVGTFCPVCRNKQEIIQKIRDYFTSRAAAKQKHDWRFREYNTENNSSIYVCSRCGDTAMVSNSEELKKLTCKGQNK